MTRAKLEQVRKSMDELIEFVNDEGAIHTVGRGMEARSILDAELAKPEVAREWRAAHDVWWCPKRGGDPRLVASDCGEIQQSKNKVQADENLLCNATGEYRALNVRIESRTPAGPWERAE